MSDHDSRARVSADIVDEIALASDDSQELLSRLSRSRFLGDAHLDTVSVIAGADLDAHDVALVEVVTRSATANLILETLEAMCLQPAPLADVLRVLLSHDRAQRQHLPYIVFAHDVRNRVDCDLALSHAYDDTFTVVRTSCADDPLRPAAGWSDHCLMVCRHTPRQSHPPG